MISEEFFLRFFEKKIFKLFKLENAIQSKSLDDSKLKAKFMNEIGTICCEQIRALTQNKAYNQEPKFVEQKLRRAELMYSNAIKMNPDEILYFINRANVLVDLKEWQQLEKILKVLVLNY